MFAYRKSMICMKKIGVFVTQYSLLVYLLISKDWRDTQFIFSGSRISTEIIRKLGLCVKFPIIGAYTVGIGEMIRKNSNFLLLFFFRVAYKLLRMRMKIKFSCWKYFLKTQCIKVYGQDHAEMASFFFDYDFTLIEDGASNYFTYDQLLKDLKVIGLDNLDKFCPLGWNNYVNTIYLSGRGRIPAELEHKTKIFDLHEQWKCKSEKEQKDIMGIFNFDYDKMYNIVSSGKNVFLLTQNLSPLYFSASELVNIYKDILSPYSYENVVIKPHPVDYICYEEFFPSCMVLRDEFPFELMYFTAIPIKKVVSIDSTAIMGLWDSSLIDAHPEYSPHKTV